MTNPLNTPWTLHFDRDGTEDVAVLRDATGDTLVTSRPFWLPEDDDPIPPTLAAMRLLEAAPDLRDALDCLLTLTVDLNLKYGISLTESETAARAKAQAALARADGPHRDSEADRQTTPDLPAPPDVDALIEPYRKIAVVWSAEDVQEVRSDLDDDQAWAVLRRVRDAHDAGVGVNWDVIGSWADHLYGPEPDQE